MTGGVPFNDVARVHRELESEISSAFIRVYREGRFILGEEVSAFEKEWAAYNAVPHAIGCASGTAALSLALAALELKPGDEVITTPLTFFATTEAILLAGARPVFVDVLPESGLLDPARLETALTPRTRAVLPVHLYGRACSMDSILRFCEKHDLYCVEDAAQAHGARWNGRFLGTLGNVGCSSFFPGKNLGALGDAGGLMSHDPALSAKMRKLRDHGRKDKYIHDELGSNDRMDGLQAAFLRVKLPYLEQWNRTRSEIADFYLRELSGIENLGLPPYPSANERPAWHLFVVQHPERDRLARQLQSLGIETGIHYPLPCHLQPAWQSRFPTRSSLPAAEQFASRCLSLPLFGAMTGAEAERVVAALHSILEP